MSYLDKGREIEDRLIARMEEDPEEGCIFPCFAESCTNELLQNRVDDRIAEAYANPKMFPHLLLSIFAEYLYEEYDVVPEDCEFICQAMIVGIANIVEDALYNALTRITSGKAFIDSQVKPKRNNIIDLSTFRTNKEDNHESE